MARADGQRVRGEVRGRSTGDDKGRWAEGDERGEVEANFHKVIF